jgi:hypothetical protein
MPVPKTARADGSGMARAVTADGPVVIFKLSSRPHERVDTESAPCLLVRNTSAHGADRRQLT